MLLLLLAGVFTSIACATAVVNGLSSAIGKVLTVVVIAIGTVFGVTIFTIAASLGVIDVQAALIGMVVGAVVVIAGNAAVRKLIHKAKLQRDY